ncbi:hypothetical protein CH249_15345 [Rhodococcus sp. 05-2255-3B1]|nr:hypothetical protein CH250_23410 [Rhodococcus sp. 05-2255-3C]OZE09554.1 hypothetical protein CH249_15345 [Rhodococcus sp. 05-2255-3B1]OZE14820.1 hypothetical protein CH255_21690 [Rhodococcus sp. 05-2255-2A2]
MNSILRTSRLLESLSEFWVTTAEITTTLDARNRTSIRASLQLLAALGYISETRHPETGGILYSHRKTFRIDESGGE